MWNVYAIHCNRLVLWWYSPWYPVVLEGYLSCDTGSFSNMSKIWDGGPQLWNQELVDTAILNGLHNVIKKLHYAFYELKKNNKKLYYVWILILKKSKMSCTQLTALNQVTGNSTFYQLTFTFLYSNLSS